MKPYEILFSGATQHEQGHDIPYDCEQQHHFGTAFDYGKAVLRFTCLLKLSLPNPPISLIENPENSTTAFWPMWTVECYFMPAFAFENVRSQWV